MRTPNHRCKYSKCSKGIDENGNPCRKLYYACDYCDRTASWRSVACSPECYQGYIEEVLAARADAAQKTLYPDRLDKTTDQVAVLLREPVEKVAESTKNDLSDYSEALESEGLAAVMESINKEIDTHAKSRSRKKRTKSTGGD